MFVAYDSNSISLPYLFFFYRPSIYSVECNMFGLLGTVLGMIKVFGVIKEQGIGQAAALSGGISEALITTVTGLFVGIPVLIFYNYFARKAENFVLDIEKYSIFLIQKIGKLNKIDSTENSDLSNEEVVKE